MPVLYVVATPIGNLEDITLRALRILREVPVIAAEDTRKTKILLAKYGIKTQLVSYFEHSRKSKIDSIIERLESGDVALVSEAGTPGINDPGYALIVAAAAKGIRVVPVPGPSIVVTALSAAGLPAARFLYVGFLPNRSIARRKVIQSLADETATIVLLESPRRILAALGDILSLMGNRRLAVCREITKFHEETYRGDVTGAIAHFRLPRGEFAMVLEGKSEPDKPVVTGEITARMLRMRKSGMSAKEAVSQLVKDTSISRRELYRKWLALK